MEYIEPSQTPVPEAKPEDKDAVNVKTEEAVHSIENEIAKTYNVVESQVSGLWLSASKNANELQEKYKLEERRKQLLSLLNNATTSINEKAKITENIHQIEDQLKNLTKQVDFKNLQSQANNALDKLDSKLEIVEKEAVKYASQFASFFSGIVSVNPVSTKTDDDLTQGETLFDRNVVSQNYGNSRYDTEIYKLHTTPSYYLEADGSDDAELKDFQVDLKTEEIAGLLAKYPDTLEKLMNSLVPVKATYELFWFRYFKAELKLKESEAKRKELLSKKKKSEELKGDNGDDDDDDDDEEEFTWDDDEEEDEDEGDKKK